MTPQISIYMHKLQPFHPMQLEAIARHTKRSYDLTVICEPGTVHENMLRAFKQARSRYFVLLDDDCIVLDDGWLDRLIEDLQDCPTLGAVTLPEMKNLRSVRAYRKCREDLLPTSLPQVFTVKWIPGYLMAFDLERVPGIDPDVKIPHPKGMSDVDVSLQVRAAGFHVGVSTRSAVYHPYKGGVTEQMREESKEQMDYMFQKWGTFFADAITSPAGFITTYPPDSGMEESEEDLCHRPDYVPA